MRPHLLFKINRILVLVATVGLVVLLLVGLFIRSGRAGELVSGGVVMFCPDLSDKQESCLPIGRDV